MSDPPSEASRGPKIWTIGSFVSWAVQDFRARGLESPRLDAELLIAHALEIDRIRVILDGARPLEGTELATLRELVRRRRSFEPIAYLRGEREFYGLRFRVDKRVLVPRPDTEALVDVALARSAHVSLSMRQVDLCTGSGCVAIAMARQRPTAQVSASDISVDALAVARDNALRLGAYNVAFAMGDIFAPFADRTFDVVTANPPYIPTAEIATLMPDVRDHEPHLALDGGADGLDVVRRIVAHAPDYLDAKGLLAIEVGAGQALMAALLLKERGFSDIRVDLDIARIERVVSGVLHG